jgi:hypothetical protein
LKSVAELVQLTGVSAGQIAVAVRTGFVAAAQRGRYQIGLALVGLIKFLNARVGTLPTYDNPAQCSELTGIPLAAIKAARRAGKVGQDGRISLAPLLKVLFDDHGENWIEMQSKFAALREKGRYELETGEMIPKSDVAAAIQRANAVFWRMMDQRSNVDLPPLLEGLDALQRQQELVRSDTELKKAWCGELATLTRNGEAKNGQ